MLSRVIDITLLERDKLEAECKDDFKTPLLSSSSMCVPSYASWASGADIDALEVRKAAFDVRGMEYASCAGAVEKALKGFPGIKDATVALIQNKVLVSYRPAFIDVRLFYLLNIAGDNLSVLLYVVTVYFGCYAEKFH